jgi:hypothetical protein
MDIMGQDVPLSDVDPAYARKLLRDTVAYARSLGLEPHPDFAGVEPVFGEISAEACDVSFEFGLDGKPFYIPGPHESAKQIDRRLRHLQERLGDDGFDVALDDDGEDDADDDETLDAEFELPEGIEPYDPEVAPNPEEWLARSEDDRRLVIEAYHRRAGIRLPRPALHAAMHVIIENQIALGDEVPVRRAIDRLMADGLERHEALHAAGTALLEHLSDVMHDARAGAGAETAESVSHEAYYTALERLTADSWRRGLEEDKDEDPDEA